MDYKAVVMDLDGTLYTDGRLHPNDVRTVERTLEKGVPVIPATTRMRYSSSQLLLDIPVDRYPIICMNGARALGPGWKDHGNYKDWFIDLLDKNIAERICRYADEKNYELSTIFPERKYWRRRDGQELGPHPDEPITWVVEENTDALEDGEPISFMIHEDRNSREGLKDFESYVEGFSGKVRLDRHHRFQKWVALTVYPSQVSKKRALELVCERMKISIDKVLAIGDDEVDIEMLEFAGKGIAMENSPEYVKQVADDIAPSCKNQGVKWALTKYILKES